MSRPFVHSGNLNFKHTLTNDLVFHNAWKRIICHFITYRRTCCWRDHSQCCLCRHLFSFATVYGRLPHTPLPTMANATLAIATVSLGGTISLYMIGIFIIGQIMVILVSVSDRYQQNSQHLQISYNNLCATEIG